MSRLLLGSVMLACAMLPAAAQDDPKSTRLDAFGDPLPKGAIARIGTTRLANDGGITGLAFSPDGKSLASANGDNAVRLWDTAAGKLVRTMKPPIAIMRSPTASAGWGPLAFSPDGKTIAAAGAGVCLWEVETGRLARWLEGGQQMMRSIAFSADSKTLAAGFGDGAIFVYEAATGKKLHILNGHEGAPNGLVFLPDNKTLASTGHDGSTRLWDLQAGKEIGKFAPNPLSNSSLAQVDGKILISAGGQNSDGILRFWDLDKKKQTRQIHAHKSGALCLAISKDGKLLASGGEDRFIRFWDTQSTAELGNALQQPGPVHHLALSPKGDLLAWGDGARVRIGTIAGLPKNLQFKELFPFTGHQSGIQSVSFSSGGKKLLSQAVDVAILWDELTGKELHRFNKGWRNAWSADGKLLAFADPNDNLKRAIHLYDADTGKAVREISAPTQVMSLAFARDQSSVFTAGSDATVYLLEIATGKVRASIKGDGHLWSIVPAPDGYTVAAVFDKEIRLFDLIAGGEIAKIPARGQSARFSPDGAILACRTYTDGILLWDIDKRKQLQRIPGRHLDLAFMPDGQTLVTSGLDETIRLWNVASAKELHKFNGHSGWIMGVAVSPDGRTLVSGGADTTLLLWPLDRFVKGKPVHAPRLSAKELKARFAKLPAGNVDEWWQALADTDPQKAYRPMWGLVENSAESLPIIEKWIEPICKTPIGELIADLDDADKIEPATLKLERLGRVARPMLQRALQGKLSAEARRRIERMLALSEIDLTGGPDEGLRMLRTVEVLEHIGSAKAQTLLAQIARSAPMPDAIDQAKGALKRLKKAG